MCGIEDDLSIIGLSTMLLLVFKGVPFHLFGVALEKHAVDS